MIASIDSNQNQWIQTFTGRKFYPLAPRRQDIDIKDIAHGLSLANRYAGHTELPYSVAQHSVMVAGLIPRGLNLGLAALLHDAAEAYLGDVVRPIKVAPEFRFYREAEHHLQGEIEARFGIVGLTQADRGIIKEADHRMLVSEARDLMPGAFQSWGDWIHDFEPIPEAVVPWSHREAEVRFLHAFILYGGKA